VLEDIQNVFTQNSVLYWGVVDQCVYDAKAPKGHWLAQYLEQAQSAFVYIQPVDKEIVAAFPETFTGEAYLQYTREKRKISEKLLEIGQILVNTLKKAGIDAVTVRKGSIHYRGAVSLKHLGYYAGLGVFGRSSLLLNPVYGPHFRIGAVITRYTPGEYSSVMDFDPGCARCNKCITVCPADALTIPEKGEYSISAQKCHHYFCTMTNSDYTALNTNVNCGLCRKVCPVG
jgi:epoxyqueuosine reductase QueG